MGVEEHLQNQYSDEEIADIAKQLDVMIQDGKQFIGVKSLCDYLKTAANNAFMYYSMAPAGKEKHAHLEAWGAYASPSHIFKRSADHVDGVLTEERKKRAERN